MRAQIRPCMDADEMDARADAAVQPYAAKPAGMPLRLGHETVTEAFAHSWAAPRSDMGITRAGDEGTENQVGQSLRHAGRCVSYPRPSRVTSEASTGEAECMLVRRCRSMRAVRLLGGPGVSESERALEQVCRARSSVVPVLPSVLACYWMIFHKRKSYIFLS